MNDRKQETSPDVSCHCASPQFVSTRCPGSTWMSVHTWEHPRGGWRKDHTHGPILGVCVWRAWHLSDPQRARLGCPPHLAQPGALTAVGASRCRPESGSCREEDLLLLYLCHLQDKAESGLSQLSPQLPGPFSISLNPWMFLTPTFSGFHASSPP